MIEDQIRQRRGRRFFKAFRDEAKRRKRNALSSHSTYLPFSIRLKTLSPLRKQHSEFSSPLLFIAKVLCEFCAV